MITRSNGHASLFLALIFAACTPKEEDTSTPEGDEGEPEVIVETLENQGFACISGAVDQVHTIEIDFGTCMSSSCDTLQSASCTVETSGAELIVQGKAEIARTQNQACTEDCGYVRTTCSTEALAAGEYTLVYAGERLDVTVPLSEAACTERS